MATKTEQIAQRFFMTGVSLVTSYGKHGKNVMAAEWTMQVSYDPLLIAVFIHEGSNTLGNIKNTKKFGINMASEDQATLVSIAGGYSRKELDKLAVSDLFKIRESKQTCLPILLGCVVNAECKLETIKKIGDHEMVVGRVVSIKHDESKKPLVYHRNRYFKIGSMIEPVRHKITVSKAIFDLFSLQNTNTFILKCTGTLVRSKHKILVLNDRNMDSNKTIPYICPKKGTDQKKELEKYLKGLKIKIVLKEKPTMKRLVIKYKGQIQRINFVLFDGILKGKSDRIAWKLPESDSFLNALTK